MSGDSLNKIEQLFKFYPCRVLDCTVTGWFRSREDKTGQRFAGFRIWFPWDTPLPIPAPHTNPSPNSFYSRQFVGMHDHLVVTVQRPLFIDNLFHISDKVPEIRPFGSVVWMGTCSYAKASPRSVNTGWVITIPTGTCPVMEPHLRDRSRIHLKAIVHPLSKHKKEARGTTVLEFPSLPRQWFDVSIV